MVALSNFALGRIWWQPGVCSLFGEILHIKFFFWVLTQESELPSGFDNSVHTYPLLERKPSCLCAFHESDGNVLHFLHLDLPSFIVHCFELSFFQEWSSLVQSNHVMHTTFGHCGLYDFCLAMPSCPEIVLYELEKHALQWQIWNFGFRLFICQPYANLDLFILHASTSLVHQPLTFVQVLFFSMSLSGKNLSFGWSNSYVPAVVPSNSLSVPRLLTWFLFSQGLLLFTWKMNATQTMPFVVLTMFLLVMTSANCQ